MSPALGIFLTILLLAINAFFVAGGGGTQPHRHMCDQAITD